MTGAEGTTDTRAFRQRAARDPKLPFHDYCGEQLR